MKPLVWSIILLLGGLFTVRAQEPQTLIVFAAASLTDAFEELATQFEAENPGVDILFNFAGSSDLAAQILEGAPADVFASANTAQMQIVQDADQIAGQPLPFAQNRLVLIVPADNPAQITTLDDLANDGVQLILAAPGVPIRTYTDTLLERLAADPAYGEAYRSAVLSNLVSEEQNVRQVTAKIALGEADAGIVYVSDVTPEINDQVIAIAIPDALNTIATYPIAITRESTHPALAQMFIDYVLSEAGQSTLADWNFIPVSTPEPEPTPSSTCGAQHRPR
jgi:molybdate transport system substrate-binding protein